MGCNFWPPREPAIQTHLWKQNTHIKIKIETTKPLHTVPSWCGLPDYSWSIVKVAVPAKQPVCLWVSVLEIPHLVDWTKWNPAASSFPDGCEVPWIRLALKINELRQWSFSRLVLIINRGRSGYNKTRGRKKVSLLDSCFSLELGLQSSPRFGL